MPSSAPSPSTFSGGDRERTAQDVHATLCALVMAEAATHEAWADYAAVLLDEETAAFFAARLPEAKAKAAGGESGSPPSKKRKNQDADSGASGDITLRVACLDGSSIELTVPPRELVREVKRAIGQVRAERNRAGLQTLSRRSVMPLSHITRLSRGRCETWTRA
jgi:hypothetical protein